MALIGPPLIITTRHLRSCHCLHNLVPPHCLILCSLTKRSCKASLLVPTCNCARNFIFIQTQTIDTQTNKMGPKLDQQDCRCCSRSTTGPESVIVTRSETWVDRQEITLPSPYKLSNRHCMLCLPLYNSPSWFRVKYVFILSFPFLCLSLGRHKKNLLSAIRLPLSRPSVIKNIEKVYGCVKERCSIGICTHLTVGISQDGIHKRIMNTLTY